MNIGAALSAIGGILKTLGVGLVAFLLRKGAVDKHKRKEAEAHNEIRDKQIKNHMDRPSTSDDTADRMRTKGW